MAFEITRQEILKQAIELKKLYDSTRIQSYKDQELRLRRIVVELDNLTPLVSVPTLAQVTTAGNTTTNAITVGAVNSNGNVVIGGASSSGAFQSYNGFYAFSFGTSASAYNPNNNYTRIHMNASITYTDNFSGNFLWRSAGASVFEVANASVNFWNTSSVIVTKHNAATGNFLIGTTTDAGYKLDVNGTARVQGAFTATLANVSTANVVYYNSSTGLMTYGAAPSGTVTSVATGTGLSGGTITTSGTIALANTTVTAGSYTLASITVDAQGRITAASNGSAGGTGTVTSVGLSSATSGVTIGATPVTTSGTITIAIATASGSQNGLLSSTDWTTFNNKQNALTLTTTGSSGAATLIGGVLNIPNYGSALTGYVPYTGATTNVNLGTHQLLAARGTFSNNGSTNTLTVDHTSGSGYGIIVTKGGANEALYVNKTSGSGNAATIIGGITLISELNLTTDLADSHIASAATWNAKQNAITLTTTGNSGAATFVSSTLNIPNYTLAGLGGQPQLNGTGFVKISGTTISYDNSTYYLASNPSGYTTNVGTVTSVGGTGTVSGLTLSGTVTSSGNLTLGGTLSVLPSNFASQTANTVLAAPNGTAGVPTFRVLVAADIPTLNQNTTGSAASLTTARTLTIGSTGKTFNGTANVGWTLAEIGAYAATNPSGYTTNTGTVTSIVAGTGLSGGTITTTGTIALANTTVTAGSYTLASITVDAQGRITAASNGSAGGTGTVTSVGLSSATSGVTIGATPVTTSGTITIAIATAATAQNGLLSSTDWNTFNGKQAALSGTGFVKISGTTISYDNSTYYLASNPSGYTTNVGTVTSVSGTGTVSGLTLSGTVTASGNLTLGGTLSLTSGNVTTALGFTPYNATNPAGYTTNTGTVTSVGLSSATSGVTIGATPVTTSGTITIAIATASGSQNGLLSSTNWTTFNNKQNAISLTTTGTSGAATFVSNTLNIPNYTLAGLGYSVPTLAQVTTAGNTTTNSITVGGLTVDTNTLVVDATNNRVGIGTATPSYPLHISSAAAANIYGTVQSTSASGTAAWVAFNDQSDNVVYRVFGSGASGTQMGIALARTASLIANLGGAGSFLLGTYSATNFIMGTGNAEKMRIVDSTGNILIATTTDLGNKLEVNGTINATDYKVGNVAGWNGIINIPTMPPVMITVTNGIITNVM
jgi:hypothetical protein